jgi:hypothetical protein
VAEVWSHARLTGTLQEDLGTLMVIFHWILLRMRNISDKSCTENQNTLFCSITFFWKSWHLWDNMEKYGRAGQATDDNTIQHRKDARIHTHIYSQYWTLITFPQQQWLHKCTWMLHYTYIACLVRHTARSTAHSTDLWPMLMTDSTYICTQYGLEFCCISRLLFDSSP